MLVCVAMTLAVNTWVTRIGFLHLFLAGYPTPAFAGIALGVVTSAYLIDSAWCILLVGLQLIVVGVAYYYVATPFANPFP